jgi:hypothetical protein
VERIISGGQLPLVTLLFAPPAAWQVMTVGYNKPLLH